MTRRKRIAVIGAGASGIIAIKSLKEEGLEPICFEKSPDLGGMWRYNTKSIVGTASAMWSPSMNNSKEIGAISDFPPKSAAANFMRHNAVLDMFTDYANHFNVGQHIRYNTEIVSVTKTDDYHKTGRWSVAVCDIKDSQTKTEEFDGVFVCTGHLAVPNIPKLKGMSRFRGDVIHTYSVKTASCFEGRNVCVLGAGYSGLDAAVEISHLANQVYLSVRTPSWILPRQGPYGYPIDWTCFHHDVNLCHKFLPDSWGSKYAQEVYINPRMSHSLYNIKPSISVFGRDPVMSDELSSRIMNGSVILKKNIQRLTENAAVFEDDEEQEVLIDCLLLGTGYNWDFPFLNDADLVTEGTKIHLYKFVFPPHLQHPTLAVVGFLVPFGPIFPCVELQCRWASRVVSGKCQLPSFEGMMEDIDRQYNSNCKRFDCSKSYIHVDYPEYTDDLASKIGVKPNLWKMVVKDFRLFIACMFQAFVPYRYRLEGPHKWVGARQAIITASQRMRYPMHGKTVFKSEKNKFSKKKKLLFIIFIGLAWLLWRNKFSVHELATQVYLFCTVGFYLFRNVLKIGAILFKP